MLNKSEGGNYFGGENQKTKFLLKLSFTSPHIRIKWELSYHLTLVNTGPCHACRLKLVLLLNSCTFDVSNMENITESPAVFTMMRDMYLNFASFLVAAAPADKTLPASWLLLPQPDKNLPASWLLLPQPDKTLSVSWLLVPHTDKTLKASEVLLPHPDKTRLYSWILFLCAFEPIFFLDYLAQLLYYISFRKQIRGGGDVCG